MVRRTSKKRTRGRQSVLRGAGAGRSLGRLQLRHLRQEVSTYVARPERFFDLVGEKYSAEHPASTRRSRGITLTPPDLVEQMVAMTLRAGLEIKRIVDPGAGTGRFTIAAARAFPNATVVAIEYDRELARLLLANLTAAGLGDRVQVLVGDFRTATLPRIEGATLFVGNPPYVRHHDIQASWKQWYSSRLAMHGIRGSQLAGLHAHFMVKTFDLAHEGDLVCYVMSSEWLDTGYGAAIRALLLAKGRDVDIALLDPSTSAFQDAMTTSAVVMCRVMRGSTMCCLRQIRSIPELTGADRATATRSRDLSPAEPWTKYARNETIANWASETTLGDLFSVHRGQVTGNNMIWIEGGYPGALPEDVLFPTVTRARELLDLASDRLADARTLRRVIDISPDWRDQKSPHAEHIRRFLDWAGTQGGRESYIAQHRNPWFKVGLRDPAPIVMTYMARRPPRFVRNLCGARLINIAHGLYPRDTMSARDLDSIVRWLNGNVSRGGGRTYAGGLTKFEPREAERIRLPSLEELRSAGETQ